VSIVVVKGSDHGIGHFNDVLARESTKEKVKKNSRVSPCFLHLKILKEPFWAT
jgi:hypothetical protein